MPVLHVKIYCEIHHILLIFSFLLFTCVCSQQKCRLLSTHDDYSMTSKFPKEKTSVVTILRDPINRVFSTYEFSMEVAARFLVHPNLTSATQMALRLRSKAKGVSTLDIWPWKYLVPWMREDLFARVCLTLFVVRRLSICVFFSMLLNSYKVVKGSLC
jgi:hypothetical protein